MLIGRSQLQLPLDTDGTTGTSFPYLDPIQRSILHFDFEVTCSITLEIGSHCVKSVVNISVVVVRKHRLTAKRNLSPSTGCYEVHDASLDELVRTRKFLKCAAIFFRRWRANTVPATTTGWLPVPPCHHYVTSKSDSASAHQSLRNPTALSKSDSVTNHFEIRQRHLSLRNPTASPITSNPTAIQPPDSTRLPALRTTKTTAEVWMWPYKFNYINKYKTN